MAVTVLPRDPQQIIYPKQEGPTWGQIIGGSLGPAVGAGAEQMAKSYLGRKEKTRKVQDLIRSGVPRDQAMVMAEWDPKEQAAFLSNYWPASPSPDNQANAQTMGGMGALGGLMGQGARSAPQPTAPNLVQLLNSQLSGQPLGRGQLFPGQQDSSQFPILNEQPMMQPQDMQQPEVYQRTQAPVGQQFAPIDQQQVPQQPQQRPLTIAEARKGAGGQKEERKQLFKEQQTIQPYIHAEAQEYIAQRKASDIAKKMLENIEKNKQKWPGALLGNLPAKAQQLLLRDKDIRKYIADANSLVIQLAGTRKGMPTNFKIKLEQLAKADLSQPIDTQIDILKDVIGGETKSKDRQKYINSLKNESGNYPLDIEQRVTEFSSAQDYPLEFPQFYKNGTLYVDDNGKKYVLKNGQWAEKGA